MEMLVFGASSILIASSVYMLNRKVESQNKGE